MAKGERHKKTRIFRIHDRTFLYQDMGVAAKELMLLNCGVGEDSCESLGLQGTYLIRDCIQNTKRTLKIQHK